MITNSEIQQARQMARENIAQNPEWLQKEMRMWSRSLEERHAFWRSIRPRTRIDEPVFTEEGTRQTE